MPTVLLVEDDPTIRSALVRSLSKAGHVVRAVGTALDALREVTSARPDVVILDLGLPDLDGADALRMLRGVCDVPVVVATARDNEREIVRLLNSGADDYLVKPFSFLELLARLQALQRRGRAQEPTQLKIANLQIDLIARKAWRGSERIDLSAKEFALLAVLARRQGEILSKTAIAELVWDMNFDSNTNVVEVAIKRLRAKVDNAFTPKLLHTIRGMGYVMEARDEAPPDEEPAA